MDIAKEIKALRNKVLVHSCIYYCMDDNIVDDHTWQRWADSLAKLQRKYPAENASVEYYAEAFEDFTGATGSDLPLLNPDIVKEAKALMLKHGKPIVEPHLPI